MRCDRFKVKWCEFGSVLRTEYKHIFTDAGVILVLVIALLLYSTVYSLAYKNQVLRSIPVAVVDMSQTASSRHLARVMDATPNIEVAYKPSSMDEARALFFDRKVNGIVYIPENYEQRLLKGVQANVGIYADASYFLMYKQFFYDAVAAINSVGHQVKLDRYLAADIPRPIAQAVAEPLVFKAKNLYNPYGGYGTFIMPAIIIVIIQQTLLIGIGMIGGTWREFGIYRKLVRPGEKRLSVIPIVLGKAVTYTSIYAVTGFVVLGLLYKLFGFPMNAPFLRVVAFMVPYLLCCIFLGIAVSTLFRYRENSLIFLLWSSIPVLLISGASIPAEGLPHGLYLLGKLLPSSNGVEGFLRIQTMGASLSEVWAPYCTLWVLMLVFFVLACLGLRRVISREMRAAQTETAEPAAEA
ncbi:MAG: ABC transporter permease [Rikenellaceae bacterium]|nr:ABC transporter permease [Rikenellaceae bacterium]